MDNQIQIICIEIFKQTILRPPARKHLPINPTWCRLTLARAVMHQTVHTSFLHWRLTVTVGSPILSNRLSHNLPPSPSHVLFITPLCLSRMNTIPVIRRYPGFSCLSSVVRSKTGLVWRHHGSHFVFGMVLKGMSTIGNYSKQLFA